MSVILPPEFNEEDPTVKTWTVTLKDDGFAVKVHTTPGSRFVATTIVGPPRVGTYPPFQFQVLHPLQQAKGLYDYLNYAVRRALKNDGVEDSRPMPINFEPTDFLRMVLVMSRDEVTMIARSIQAAIAHASSLVVPR